MKLAIIIPVFNEEDSIEKILSFLFERINDKFTNEIIVVDGGSTDTTLEILNNFSAIKIIHSQKGRAIQMNEGAKNTTSEILYFLHCDTFPPINFDIEIVEQVKKGSLSGCFRMKFDNKHIVLQVSQWFTRFNFKSCRGGDQSLFVEKKLFEKLNGFNEKLRIYEDNEFIIRLYENSKFTVIPKTIITSSRKYIKNGIWKLQYHFLMIHIFAKFGYSQQNLAKYYYQNVK